MNIPPRIMLPIDQLKVDGLNPNWMSQKDKEALKKSIQQYGFPGDIVTDENYMIADGEHRWEAAKDLGMAEVPVIALPLTDVQRRTLRQVLNKLHGEHDSVADRLEFIYLQANDGLQELIDLLPSEENEILALLKSKDEPIVPEPVEDDYARFSKKCPVKEGDVWVLGRHLLYCQDSEKIKALNQPAHLILTDPPYGEAIGKMNYTTSGPVTCSSKKDPNRAKRHDYRHHNKEWDNSPPSEAVMANLLSLGKNAVIFGGNFFKLPPSRCWLVWDKKGAEGQFSNDFADCELAWTSFDKPCRILRYVWSGYNQQPGFEREKRFHPTQKPVELFKDILNRFTKENQMVYDPYAGAGATLLACEATKRIAIGVEQDPAYCAIIISRWETLTGQKAEKQGGSK